MQTHPHLERDIRDHLTNQANLTQALLDSEQVGKALALAANLCLNAVRGGHALWFVGNGISAVDAQRMAALVMTKGMACAVPVRAFALATDGAMVTALANDHGVSSMFTWQIKSVCKPGDVLLAFSSSGNSPNVVEGLRLGKIIGMASIGFMGAKPGEMARWCDACLHVPSAHSSLVQDAHVTLGRVLATLLMDALKSGGSLSH
ncbi:D-sedoheptulose-7-phosphate isomerase [Aquabacterium sp.]|uniref:D-sedoheptulose-7-phosphate isomerase n=1 Tax=Aquabacterium sp. TaxID=1872578 RepID=UPI003D6C9DC1